MRGRYRSRGFKLGIVRHQVRERTGKGLSRRRGTATGNGTLLLLPCEARSAATSGVSSLPGLACLLYPLGRRQRLGLQAVELLGHLGGDRVAKAGVEVDLP